MVTIGIVTDATAKYISGLGYRIIDPNTFNTEKKLNIKLTIDWHIQKIVEDVLNENNIVGSVVIEDIVNGDIIAICSKPDFNPNQIEEYLHDSYKPLFNRAIASYPPGSIFKVITAAAALENGYLENTKYNCEGKIDIGSLEFKCSSYNIGHGTIDMYKAFSLSCNPYFINVGIKTGKEKLFEMAKAFGIGIPTGLSEQNIEESYGYLPLTSEIQSNGDIANISIGQGKLLITPVQAADIAAIIANGGIKNNINIVDSIINDDGNKIRNYKNNYGNRVISIETAHLLKKMMDITVTQGTGKKANIDAYGGCGGKTGTAETGQVKNEEKVVHAWFIGYFPKTQPKYSMSVFIEDGKSGGGKAAPIFAEIAEKILDMNY